MSEVKVNGEKIQLKGVKVLFHTDVDTGFGLSITVDVTDKDVKAGIEKWVKENKIGKNGDAGKGVAKIKDYEGTLQFGFRYNDKTKFVGREGLVKENIGYGAIISLSANAFPYEKFGGGVGSSLSAVVIERAGSNGGADADVEDLLEGEPIDLSEIPFNQDGKS